jgi:subtilase family serine protease
MLLALLGGLLLHGVLSPLAVTDPSTHLDGAPDGVATGSPTPVATSDDQFPTRMASGSLVGGRYLFTPDELRAAYNVTPLLRQGYTGAGQSVVVIESYGNPSLARDVAAFNAHYGLPPADIQVLAPLGTVPYNSSNWLMRAWAYETDEDVETIHAMAPGARIVVLTSPVAENEGTSGLPQFLALERYAVEQHLGNVISQSWGATEVTLDTVAGRQTVAEWDSFFMDATLQDGMSFFASSGDHGATDYGNLQMTALSPTRTLSFPSDDPWVTSVGGTSLKRTGDTFHESGWSGSGGGMSRFFSIPGYQLNLPDQVQSMLAGRRGVPDVAAAADFSAGLGIYVRGHWYPAVGTSTSAPFWAALGAIANQMAGHPLGFLNSGLYALLNTPQYPLDFNDLIAGNNSYVGHGVSVPGFNAAPGWDPVTGLGSPDAAHLLPDLIAQLKQRDCSNTAPNAASFAPQGRLGGGQSCLS